MNSLTVKEKKFAEDYHYLVYYYLSAHHLCPDEYYDIAAMGYLRSVKKWFARFDLRKKYKFTTIAWSCMRTDVGNYHRTCKRHTALSLDSPISNSASITFADIIPDCSLSIEERLCIRETIASFFHSGGGIIYAILRCVRKYRYYSWSLSALRQSNKRERRFV